MNVLIVCQDDWANVGYSFEQSLRKVGVSAISLKVNKHSFGYPKQSPLFNEVPHDELLKFSFLADCIIWMHSQMVDVPVGIFSYKKKKLFVFHGGTAYRQSPTQVRDFFYGAGIKNYLIQNIDLLGENVGLFEMPDEKEFLMFPAIDTDYLLPIYKEGKRKVVISHHPRGKQKGTKEINKVMSEFDGIVKYNTSLLDAPVPWQTNIDRIQNCDIYISALPSDGVTGIGVTALEAATMGKIVLNPLAEREKYAGDYGEIPFFDVQDGDGLRETINHLISLDMDHIRELQEKTRKWAEEYISYRATGERLIRAIEAV